MGLSLTWNWSFRDILSIQFMCLIGSMSAGASALGNEPSYAASFASGLALRIALAQDSAPGLGFIKVGAGWVENGLKSYGVSFESSQDVASYSAYGIGDCGGGPFRMLFGDGPQARWVAICLKTWLMIMPILSSLQWLQRSMY